MKDEYKSIANSYDEQLKDKLTKDMYKEWKNELEKAIKKYKVKVKTLVDLGCGTGITSVCWLKNKYDIIGVELSKPMLKEAKKKSKKVKWICQDIVNLNIKDMADAVTCHFDVLNHIVKKKDLQKVFNNTSGILNEGGLFIFDVMSPESFEWLKKKGRKNEYTERSYSKEELKTMLRKAGFNVLKIKKQKTPEWDGKPRRLIFLTQKKR
tara:strand:- start:1143 stop:1769 length:627 start_codon:yes stop_codon:yes gene_type:complete